MNIYPIYLGILLGFFIIWLFLIPRFTRNNLKKFLIRLILIIIIFDAFCTIISQSPGYWHNYSKFCEVSLLGQKLLAWHPLSFIFGVVFWIILATIFLSKLSFLLSHLLFFALFLGHSFGSWTWFQEWLKNGIEILIGQKLPYSYWRLSDYFFYILVGFIFAIILRKVCQNK